MKIKGGSVCIVCSRKEQCKISSAAVEIPCYFWYLTSAEKTARTTGLFDFCYVFLSSYSYVTLTLVIKPLRMCRFSIFSPVFLKGNFVFLCIFELPFPFGKENYVTWQHLQHTTQKEREITYVLLVYLLKNIQD